MLIDKIFEILNAKTYSCIKKEKIAEVYHIENDMLLQDKFIQVVYDRDQTKIFVVSRGDAQKIAETDDEGVVIAIIVTLCYKFFERENSNSVFTRDLRQAVEENKLQLAQKMILDECSNNVLSVGCLMENTICLLFENDLGKVVFKGQDDERIILEGAKLSRAFVVAYNYAKLLDTYIGLFGEMKQKFGLMRNSYYSILNYYMF